MKNKEVFYSLPLEHLYLPPENKEDETHEKNKDYRTKTNANKTSKRVA
jgi:hypothetical protein